jgi:hypothetical protein
MNKGICTLFNGTKAKTWPGKKKLGSQLLIIMLDILGVVQFIIIWVFDILNDISRVLV